MKMRRNGKESLLHERRRWGSERGLWWIVLSKREGFVASVPGQTIMERVGDGKDPYKTLIFNRILLKTKAD